MRPLTPSKFKIFEQSINHHSYFNKLVDERAFFEVFPNVMDSETLEPFRRSIASFAKGNLIDKDGTLMRVFEQNARVVNTNKRYVDWKISAGEGDIRASVISTDLLEGLTEIGKANSVFEITLDVEWFGPNDVLILDDLREMPLIVRSEPVPDGEGWEYEVALLTSDRRDYLTHDDIKVGKRLLQIGSFIPESTINRGNIHFGEGDTFVEFQVPMTRMGWEMKITDLVQLASKNYTLSCPECSHSGDMNQNGLETDVLWSSLEMKFMYKTNRMIDLWLTYGRMSDQFSGRFLEGMTERDMQAGPGLFEFLESSYILDYPINAFNLDLFGEFLPTLWNDKVPTDQRVTHIYTGMGGLKLWQDAAQAADLAGVLQTADVNYAMDQPALFPGRKGVTINAKQYRAVFLEPFGLIVVHHLPFLDSELVETRRYKNLPITSYQFIIFDYGYGDGRDSNVFILKNEDVEQYGYITGTWGPLGPMNGKNGARMRGQGYIPGNGKENAFYYFRETMMGLVVKDPSYMIWARPNFI